MIRRVRVWRFLYDSEGRVVTMRVVVTLIVTIGLAFFGTMLLMVTPAIGGGTTGQIAWVLFAIAGLKMPLILTIWHFVLRHAEWPDRPRRWSPKESREILAYIDGEARRALDEPDAEARLEYLAKEAWHVADAMEGEEKVDALTVALRVDEARARAARRAH